MAIKVLAPQLAAVAAARKRFAREARAAAAVSHEHVVPIYAVDEFKGLPYLVMPFVAGESLQDRLDRQGPLDVPQILRIGMQAAAGLAAAHAQGLIHRDIKPSNILLENGVERVKITDFGLARTVDDASLTQSGVLAGTPQYMAPEQARGEPLDPRADLFSLGGVMYAMCLGRPPFRAASALAVLKRVCDDAPRPIREVNPEIPAWLADIIMKLLAKDPDDRYASAAQVATVLEGRLAELQRPMPARIEESTLAIAAPPPRRRLVTAAFVILGVLAVLGWTEATAVTNVSELLATILRIKTAEGTLLVQVDDPAVDVSVDAGGKELTITGAGVHEVKLRPGPHQLKVTKDGKPLREELITITRGGKQVARIEREGEGRRRASRGEGRAPIFRALRRGCPGNSWRSRGRCGRSRRCLRARNRNAEAGTAESRFRRAEDRALPRTGLGGGTSPFRRPRRLRLATCQGSLQRPAPGRLVRCGNQAQDDGRRLFSGRKDAGPGQHRGRATLGRERAEAPGQPRGCDRAELGQHDHLPRLLAGRGEPGGRELQRDGHGLGRRQAGEAVRDAPQAP